MNGPAGVRALLEDLFARAVAAAHPATCLPRHLPAPPRDGQLILLAAGKAAGSMIEIAEQHYLDTLKFPAHRMSGIAVARALNDPDNESPKPGDAAFAKCEFHLVARPRPAGRA